MESTQILSLDDLLQELINKGLIIKDVDRAKRYLTHIGYYRLINYSAYFQTNKQFRKNVSFDDVLNLYIFDRKLRLLILEAVERIEVSIRASIADVLALKHNDSHFYANPDMFTNKANHSKFMDKVIDSLKNSDITHNDNYTQSMFHNGKNHKLPPSWELFHLMTFKQLSVFVANLKHHNSKMIADKFNLRMAKVFISWIHSISDLRNICAHHSRVWNRLFGTIPMVPQLDASSIVKIPDEINVEENLIKIKPHRKLYFQVVILWFFLKQINPGSTWVSRLSNLIDEYKIPAKHMGFPDDWLDDKFWKI